MLYGLAILKPLSVYSRVDEISKYIVESGIVVSSLMAQLVKNSPAMLETWVQSLGSEDPLEKVKATHSSILVWRIPWTV